MTDQWTSEPDKPAAAAQDGWTSEPDSAAAAQPDEVHLGPAGAPAQLVHSPKPTPEDDAIGATIQRTIGKTLDAFGQGWDSVVGPQPLGSLSPDDAAKLDKLGVGPNSPNSLARATWQTVVVPAAGALDIAIRGSSALYRGLQEGGAAAGVPRDIVSIPDAFMGSPHMFTMAKPVESAVPSPIKAIDEAGALKRSDMAATGDPQIDAILKSPTTSAVIDNPVVDRSHSVPYTAGGSVPLNDPTVYIDHRFPKEIEARSISSQAPPVPDGMVRFYHGGDDPTSGGGRWVTTDPIYARDYRPGHQVSYVDLPKDALEVVKAQKWETGLEESYGSQVGTYSHFETSEEQAKGFKPLNGTVKFDPAEPFIVHENVEQHTMELLTKGGMDDASAYRVAHYEFAEKAEGAWYRSHDIDQAAAEKIYEPIMDRIQKGADDNPPENLYEKPYPHDDAHMANGPDAIDHLPTAEEIATARKIIGGDPDAPRVTGGPSDTVANSLPVARDMGLIGPDRAPGEIAPMQAAHGSPLSRDVVVDETGRIMTPKDLQESSEAGIFMRDANSGETGLAAPGINSSRDAPPSSQPTPGRQVSIRPPPLSSATTREIPPSMFDGPATTRFGDFKVGDIDPSSNRKIIQGSNDYKALHAAAEENKPKLVARLTEIVKDIDGAEFQGSRVKDLPGLEAKIKARGGRPASTVSDYLGGRIVTDSPAAMQAVLDRFGKTNGVVEAEDFLNTPKEGYRAYHVQMGMGDGTTAEVQIVPKPIADVMEEAHDIRQPVKRLDPSVPAEFEKFQQEMARGRAIFDNSWAKSYAWTPHDLYGVRLHGDHAGVTDVNNVHPDDIEITHENGVPVERPRTMASDTGVPKDATISEPAGGRVATDKAGNIRMDLIDKPEAVLDVMRQAAEENGGPDAFMEARRGQIPLGQAEAIAQAMGVDVKSLDLQGIGRKLTNDKMVETYYRAMIQSSQNIVALAKQVALSDSPENLIAFQEARMRHSVIQEQVAGLTAEWGRTGNVFQEFSEAVKGAKKVGEAVKGEAEADVRTPTEKLDDFLAGKKGEGVESVENLRKMAKTLAGMDPQTEVPKMLADARKPDFWDKLFWYRSNNLISGMITHSKYLLVNGSWMLWNSLVVKQAAAFAGDVRSVLSDKQIDRVYHGESAAEVAAMVRGFPTSIMAAARAIRDNVAPKLPGEIVKPGSGLAPGGGNPFESAFGKAAGEVIGLPGRGVTGIHTFYLTLGQRISLEGLAYRQAAKDGAKPWTMDFWDRQADHAANPSPEAMTQSVKDAYYGAFMQPLGEKGKNISRIIGQTPLRWLIPFRHVPGNLFKAGQEMTLLAFGSEELRGNLMGKNGDVARDTAIARLGLGSALGAYVVHSVLSDRMTGDGPTDQKDRAEWLLTHQPNSVRIGDRWVSYSRLGPIGDVMGIFANLGEIAPHIKDEEYGKAAAMGVVAGGRWLTDGAGMAGLADMFDLMREPDRRGVGIASNFVGGFKPFASALNQSAAAFDPNMRETRTFIDGLKIGIPGGAWGMGRESLPVKRDWLGNPVANPMQYSLLRNSKVNQDPLSAEMQHLDINPTLPERMINKVKLSPQAYDQFQVLAGVPLSMLLHQMISTPGWHDLSDAVKQAAIEATIKSVRYGDGKKNRGIEGVMQTLHPRELIQEPTETKVLRFIGAPPPK